ncbi:MAG: TolC family protein [Myxococcota bacterium]|nr:TolC family protein [Myxococcota bacterium]
MFGIVMMLGGAAVAESISLDSALQEALEHNGVMLGAVAGTTVAEGRLMAAQGVWDPIAGVEGWYAPMVSEGRSQSALYRLDMSTWGLGTTLSQRLPTGTDLSLNWRATRVPGSSYEFSILDQEFVENVPVTYTTELTAALSQSLLEGHRVAYNLQQVRTARQGLDQAVAQKRAARQSVLGDVAAAYWDLVAAGAVLSSARRSVQVAEEEARIVSALVEAGNLAPLESTRVAAAIAQTRIEVLEAEQNAAVASDALSALLGRDTREDLSPTSEPGDVPMGLNLDVDQAVAAALEGNPALRLARLSMEAAESEVLVARHTLLPDLTASGSFGVSGYEEGEFSAALNELFSRALPNHYLGLNLSAPIGNRAARGSLKSALAAVEVSRREFEEQERSVAKQAAGQARILSSAYQHLELSRLNLALAEETLSAEKARQAVGRAIQKDVLEAQRAQAQAEVAVVQARIRYRKARVGLEALQGKL